MFGHQVTRNEATGARGYKKWKATAIRLGRRVVAPAINIVNDLFRRRFD